MVAAGFGYAAAVPAVGFRQLLHRSLGLPALRRSAVHQNQAGSMVPDHPAVAQALAAASADVHAPLR